METMIEIGALGIGVTLFVLLAALSLGLDKPHRRADGEERFVPGNYHPDGHHFDDGGGHHGH